MLCIPFKKLGIHKKKSLLVISVVLLLCFSTGNTSILLCALSIPSSLKFSVFRDQAIMNQI